ncbi:MAG TPA: phosphopantothenoylcysteine decarboxylase [Pirellulaceae bacterium]|mgnify:CR=1 FL=1|nr:phosphopantothenoylcysteine decarboxylase [Pirellulaceae bacterium]
MSRILITSGPTRQYLDPVRFLSNASSGRMGQALANEAIRAGHEVIVVSGPVSLKYPAAARVTWVETTQEMLLACQREFPKCDGLIGVAAPCDYQPQRPASQKISKNGRPLTVRLIETPDIVATLGERKTKRQWTVGFALETDDARFRALAKLQRKSCDLIVVNDATAINATESQIEIVDPAGRVIESCAGPKRQLAKTIMRAIQRVLIAPRVAHSGRRKAGS